MGSSFQPASHVICHITPPPSLSSSFCLHYVCTPLTHPVFHSYPPSAFSPTCYKHLITLLLLFLPLLLYVPRHPPSISASRVKGKWDYWHLKRFYWAEPSHRLLEPEIQMNRKQLVSTGGHLLAVNEQGSTLWQMTPLTVCSSTLSFHWAHANWPASVVKYGDSINRLYDKTLYVIQTLYSTDTLWGCICMNAQCRCSSDKDLDLLTVLFPDLSLSQ